MSSVSAVILTHDRLPMLKQAVSSARWQTHGDLEIVVVANGASRETIEWLATVEDRRLVVVDLPENISPPLARNEGYKKARGDWIANLDDDDLWAPDKVERMVRAAERDDRRWAYCGVVFVDPETKVMAGRPLDSHDRIMRMLPVAYTIPGGLSGMMWRADAIPGGVELDDLPYTDDWEVAIRLLDEAGEPARVDLPLTGFRQHPGSWSAGVDEDRHEFDYVARKHAALRRGQRVQWGEHYRFVAANAARAGARLAAVKLYLRAIGHRDMRSVPRLFGALLPRKLQSLSRRTLLSDRDWVRRGEAWLAALPDSE